MDTARRGLALPRALFSQARARQCPLRAHACAAAGVRAPMSAIVFWCALALIGYAYVLYPSLVLLLVRRFGRIPHTESIAPSLTVVIAAFNESARIGARVRDVLAQDYPRER